MPEQRTPKNAPGPFYVLKDQCMTCMAPEAEAPMLMGFDDEAGSCYFRRQPETPEELYRAMRALRVACCDALRYDGSDPSVARRLIAAGSAAVIDGPIDSVPMTGRRDHVSFSLTAAPALTTPASIADAVGLQVVAMYPTGTISARESGKEWGAVVFTWAPRVAGLELRVTASAEGPKRWLLVVRPAEHPALDANTGYVDDALRHLHAADVRWYTSDAWTAGSRDWSPFPL